MKMNEQQIGANITDKINEFIGGRTVLVTGGGGTIGRALCNAAARYKPARIIIADVCENNVYMTYRALADCGCDFAVPEILSVCSDTMMNRLFERHKPDIVYHAAAHKHVSLMECNPSEAVINNVFGTENVLKYAIAYNVQRAVIISTDKAVNPVGVMGATKRVCEILGMIMNDIGDTAISAVRFGNVEGSDGSVIPIFKKQIKNGGPITLTDKRCTRYFMSIDDAVGLLLAAGAISGGGEIFALDMGEPKNILRLAEEMISERGLVPNKDIKIIETGMRPGERLCESNAVDFKTARKTAADGVYKAAADETDIPEFVERLEYLRAAAYAADDATTKKILFEMTKSR